MAPSLFPAAPTQLEGTAASHREAEPRPRGKPWAPPAPPEGRLGASRGGTQLWGEAAGLGVSQAWGMSGGRQRLFPAPGFPTAASCCSISRAHLGELGAALLPPPAS